jgi:uncharacterized protein with HEPN domain
MLEDAQDIITFAEKADSLESFSKDRLLRKAVVMSLLNIGELANRLPPGFTAAHDEVPWKSMIGMRNFAAHGYHIMNLDVIWDTVQNSIPELLVFLEEQLDML